MTKSNVNPQHYKTAGRERPGQDIVQEIQKQKYTEAKAEQETRDHGNGSKFIPGHALKSFAPAEHETDTEPASEGVDENTENKEVL